MLQHDDASESGRISSDADFVLDAFGAADYELDLPTGTLRHSARLNALYGYPLDHQLTLDHCRVRYHPDDRASTIGLLATVIASGTLRFQHEFRLVLPDDKVRYVLTRGEVVTNHTGEPILVRGAAIDITERTQMEQSLRTVEGYQRAILDSINQSVILVAPDYRILLFNQRAAQAAETVFGTPMQVGQSILTYVYPGEIASFTTHFQEALTGHEVRLEKEIHGLQGSGWWEFGYSPIVEPSGDVSGVSFTCQLITARKQAEAALRESETRMRRALAIPTVGVLFFNLDGRILDANEAFERMSGYRREDLRTCMHWKTMTPTEFMPLTGQAANELALYGKTTPYEKQLVRPDGSRWWGLFAPTRLSGSGRDAACAEFVIDITERKQMEALRAEAEAATTRRSLQLQRLALAAAQIHATRDTTTLMRIIAEESRVIIGAQLAVTSTTMEGYETQAMTEVSCSEQYAHWQGYTMPTGGLGIEALVCRTNTPMRLTQAELAAHPAVNHGDKERWSHRSMRGWLAVPLVGTDGRNLGLIQLSDKEEGEFTADDEALLIQLAQLASVALENHALYVQEQAARAQAEEASRLKDEFLATVSHELRTPLTAFLGYAQLLRRRRREEAYVMSTIEKMEHSAQVQADLIEDLLDISRIVSGKLRIEHAPLDLINVIHAALDTVRPAMDAKQLMRQVDLDPAARRVLGDAGRLQQVVWNLLSNATKFTPQGGRIRVRLRLVDGSAELTVSDTGQGIEPDFLPYIFDRFRQADSSSRRTHTGLGLGLSIVRHLVELHGGTVTATSRGAGQGATFTVRMPLIPEAVSAKPAVLAGDAEAARVGGRLPLSGMRVVVVDDQPAILEVLTELLTIDGATVQACESAEQALDLVRRWQPDLLISDIAMPKRDGYWLMEQVRKLPPEAGGATPAVGLTAYVRMNDRLRVLTSGFQQYVSKPVDTAELRDVILRFVTGTET